MDIRKIYAIISRSVFQFFTDTSLVLIMIVTPLAISSIVGLVFGGAGDDGNLTISDISVGIVNLDEGSSNNPDGYGAIITSAFLPAETDNAGTPQNCPLETENTGTSSQQGDLSTMVNASRYDEAQAAKDAVNSGDIAVAIIIPANFSQALEPQIPAGDSDINALVEIYGDSNRPVDAAIVNSIVQGFVNQFQTGNITIEAAINTLIDYNPLAAGLSASNEDVQAVLGCAFTGGFEVVSIDSQIVENDNPEAQSGFAIIIVTVGSAQAVLFALFAAQYGIMTIVEERRAGTLQRMMVTPTTRNTILSGKLFSTLVIVIFQVTLILIALMTIASIIAGNIIPIWGTNLPLIVITVLAIGLAVCGLSILIAGIARNPEQVATVGTIVNLILGLAGGAFGFTPEPPISYVSFIYWGTNAFEKLAAGQTDIWLNIVVLVVQALVLYIIGSMLFSRRVDV